MTVYRRGSITRTAGAVQHGEAECESSKNQPCIISNSAILKLSNRIEKRLAGGMR